MGQRHARFPRRRLIALAAHASVLGAALAACSTFDAETGDPSAETCHVSSPLPAATSFTPIRNWMNRLPDDPAGPGCRQCHYPGGPTEEGLIEGLIDLSTLGSLRKGGKTTAYYIIDTDDPCSSGLVGKLRGTWGAAPQRMPKLSAGYWTEKQIQYVIDWMASGAQGDDSE